jgi:hypothetical protein
MDEKRPIDLQRESAGGMTIGTPEEGPIKDFVKLNDRLMIVKSKAVYQMVLADSVDPKRTNSTMPNVQQRVLSIGVDSPLLGRTLMTAKALLNPTHLEKINCNRALELAFGVARDVSAMQDTFENLQADMAAVEEQLKGQKLVPGFAVPTIDNLNAHCESFILRAAHILKGALDIARCFYGERVKHESALAKVAENEHGADDPFVSFLKYAVPRLRFVRDVRNAVEHPKIHEQNIVRNFQLLPDGSLNHPSIEHVHPERPQGPIRAGLFMGQLLEDLTVIFETLLAYLCGHHCAVGHFPLTVAEFPEDKRTQKHVRFSYAMHLGDQLVPMG